MAKQLIAEVELQATPARVWEVLTDFAAYQEWNPFIVQAAGQAVPGSRLELHMRPPGRRTTTFRPEVLEADPTHRLRWLGRVLVPGLFDGEHSFTIHPTGPDRSRLTQHEEFHGLLAPLVLALIAKPTLEGFHQMNQALKARVEQPTPTQPTP
ncbi:MAG TPA: SRPBCC domain-containing protein [Actinomycetes bacterium]|nr:SRPBCC domain-containing protein [Actinomycetes bacterium]